MSIRIRPSMVLSWSCFLHAPVAPFLPAQHGLTPDIRSPTSSILGLYQRRQALIGCILAGGGSARRSRITASFVGSRWIMVGRSIDSRSRG
ncbi:hypothetical protein F4819DRAFT_477500 [Hypoxylon fuscum]|nr:hypothetical protein F4819DRAFT_477500 [Hypoxylon fuscum]